MRRSTSGETGGSSRSWQPGNDPGIEQLEEEVRGDLDRRSFLRQECGRGGARIDKGKGPPIPQKLSIDSKRRIHLRQRAPYPRSQACWQKMRVGASLLSIQVEANAPMLNEWYRVQVYVQHVTAGFDCTVDCCASWRLRG